MVTRADQIPRPQRIDFPDAVSFVRASHEWRQRITNQANDAFDRAFKAALSRAKKPVPLTRDRRT